MSSRGMVCLFVAGLTGVMGISAADADVFNMGPGLTSLETVPVGNSGNPADTRYDPNGFGQVDYEYNIGAYEVTAGQYAEFLNAVAATDTYGLYNSNMSSTYGCKIEQTGSSGSYSYSVTADWANRPVNFVSWGDAARFANWLHNGQPIGTQDLTTTEDGAYDLTSTQQYYGSNGETPAYGSADRDALNATLLAVNREADWAWAITSEDEWYKAAYHKDDGATANYFDYPTGSDSAPSYVNDSGNLSGTGGPFTDGGTDPGNYATYDGDGGANGIGSPYYRTEVGEWENSDSPYGAFDMGGNIWEWNEAILSGSYRGLRGGSVYSYASGMLASYRHSNYPTYEFDNFGFRVSEVPEPATLTLLALGGLAVVRRRRKSFDVRNA